MVYAEGAVLILSCSNVLTGIQEGVCEKAIVKSVMQ
jgi:hypothetical protein